MSFPGVCRVFHSFQARIGLLMSLVKKNRHNILIVEYLHADQNAFQNASDSMCSEGRGMLLALAHDAAKLPGLSATVVTCRAAAELLKLPRDVRSWTVSATSPRELAKAIVLAGESWDYVLPVAPEADGILLELVRAIQDSGIRVLTLEDTTLQTCCDKWMTYQLLAKHNLPAIPTVLLNEYAGPDFGPRAGSETCVVKPRDGVGCEGVRRVTLAEANALATEAGDHSDPMILQPWIDGESFSIALIGRGARRRPDALPLATQTIEWRGEHAHYAGGTILPEIPARISTDVAKLCDAVVDALSFRCGYLGIDLMLPKDSGEFLITEINPRICTSYVGYRRATSSNLFSRLLDLPADAPLLWRDENVPFTCQDEN